MSLQSVYCPEEYLKWSLRWNGIEAATTELVTGDSGVIDGETAIVVFSKTRSSDLASVFREVSEELTSRISLQTGRPFSNESLAVEENEREHLLVTFAHDAKTYKTSLSGTVSASQWSMVSEPDTGDLHTFLARLRVWDGRPKSGVFTTVQNGRSHYKISLIKVGNEVISTPIGKIPSIAIRGQAKRVFMDGKKRTGSKALHFTLWRSDDARFLPLRFEVETRLGLVRGTLVDARTPVSGACLRAPQ